MKAHSLLLSFGLTLGCGSRPDAFEARPDGALLFGLERSVVAVDHTTDRVVFLGPAADQELTVQSVGTGHNVILAASDKKRIFVLAGGDLPRRTQEDERPSLTVIEGDGSARRYELTAPLSNLGIDPLGRYAVAFAGADAPEVSGSTLVKRPQVRTSVTAGLVENPNEIVLFDLASPPGPQNPTTRTLRSFGGRPKRITFTGDLSLPTGVRRLLLVETELDVALLDLNQAVSGTPKKEITIRLTSGADTRRVTPSELVVDDGDPARSDDTRIGIRTSDSNVVTVQFEKSDPSGDLTVNDFSAKINLTDVGGPPSKIRFVRTDAGVRLAALVPTRAEAVLIEPETSVTSVVKLPAAYSDMSLVTDIVGASGSDVALLWNAAGASAGVAFWSLGKASGQPYRSVEVLGLSESIRNVVEVPKPNDGLRILEAASRGLFVLDLRARTAAPLTTSGLATLLVSPEGTRAWAYEKSNTRFSMIDLRTSHPTPLTSEFATSELFEVQRSDGGRALAAVHTNDTLSLTLFDAATPDVATSRTHVGLLLKDLPANRKASR